MGALLLSAALMSTGCGGGSGEETTLVMFCAAGMRKPVTKIARQYEEEYGVKIQLDFDGSGTLLGKLEVAPDGDIYLAADSGYTGIAKEKGLVAETMLVSYMRAGFGVPKGNPKGVSALADVQNKDLQIGIGNPEATSVGKFAKKILSQHELWEGFEAASMPGTVNQLANDLKLGAIDAAILWDAVAHQYADKIEFVNLPEFDAQKKDITVAVVANSTQPTEALKFCRFLTARDKGLAVFEADGYEIIEGDVWSESPEVLLYSGAMLRPAIEETIKIFEEREGVTITPVFNGCGILVGQMKSGANPDAYFSCDVKFLDMVQDRFDGSTLVTANEMVILVGKGNPKGLTGLADLAKPGLRLGFAHPEKSALGFLTKKLLESEELYQAILDSGNLEVDSPTGDFLVNQIKAGALDAVIVYKSNAMAISSTLEDFDMVEIDRPNAIAEQPFAVAKNSGHAHLLNRFLESCVSETGRERFLERGFRWEFDEKQ